MATKPCQEPPQARFLVSKKHPFRGTYWRLLNLGRQQLCTVDPSCDCPDWAITNAWAWKQVQGVQLDDEYEDRLAIVVPSVGFSLSPFSDGTSTLHFSSPCRAQVLGALKSLWNKTSGEQNHRFSVRKITRHGGRLQDAHLVVGPSALHVLSTSGKSVSRYEFRNITCLALIEDTGLALREQPGRWHGFFVPNLRGLLDQLLDRAQQIGVALSPAPPRISSQDFLKRRHEEGSMALLQPALASFTVMKLTARYPGVLQRRRLIITHFSMIEHDGVHDSANGIIACRSLLTVFEIVRCHNDGQTIVIHWAHGKCTSYRTPQRDLLVAVLCDSVSRCRQQAKWGSMIKNSTSASLVPTSPSRASPEVVCVQTPAAMRVLPRHMLCPMHINRECQANSSVLGQNAVDACKLLFLRRLAAVCARLQHGEEQRLKPPPAGVATVFLPPEMGSKRVQIEIPSSSLIQACAEYNANTTADLASHDFRAGAVGANKLPKPLVATALGTISASAAAVLLSAPNDTTIQVGSAKSAPTSIPGILCLLKTLTRLCSTMEATELATTEIPEPISLYPSPSEEQVTTGSLLKEEMPMTDRCSHSKTQPLARTAMDPVLEYNRSNLSRLGMGILGRLLVAGLHEDMDELIVVQCLLTLDALLQPRCSPRDRGAEYRVKKALLTPQACAALIDLLSAGPKGTPMNEDVGKDYAMNGHNHLEKQTRQHRGPLVISAVVRLLEPVMASRVDSTPPECFDAIMACFSHSSGCLLRVFDTPAIVGAVYCGVLLIDALLISRSPANELVRSKLQDAALSTGAVVRHLRHALFAPTHEQRALSRHLSTLWLSAHEAGLAMLRRCVPAGLFATLRSPVLAEAEVSKLEDIDRSRDNVECVVCASNSTTTPCFPGLSSRIAATRLIKRCGVPPLRRPSDVGVISSQGSVRIDTGTFLGRKATTNENFAMFFHSAMGDHAQPDLIWNANTRKELMAALDTAIADFERAAHMLSAYDSTSTSEAVNMIDGLQHKEEHAQYTCRKPCAVWNSVEFAVEYPSLRSEIRVGDCYIRLLLGDEALTKPFNGEPSDVSSAAAVSSLRDPRRFFESLYHRWLRESDVELRCVCLRAMAVVYTSHHTKIEEFDDTLFVVEAMQQGYPSRTSRTERDLLLRLLDALSLEPANLKQLLAVADTETLLVPFTSSGGRFVSDELGGCGGYGATVVDDSYYDGDQALMPPSKLPPEGAAGATPSVKPACHPIAFLCTLAAAVHVYFPHDGKRTSHSLSDHESKAKLWFLNDGKCTTQCTFISLVRCLLHEHLLPIENGRNSGLSPSLNAWCWTHGMSSWVRARNLSQLQWGALMRGPPAFASYTETAMMCLSLLLRLLRVHPSCDKYGRTVHPAPRAKRILGRLDCIRHLSQLILVGDLSTAVVDLAAHVLCVLVEHDTNATRRLYLTGVFYFALGHPGSNWRHLAKLLHITHLRQAFTCLLPQHSGYGEMAQRSVLGPLLPESMICLLERRGPEHFADVFCGSVDTPEVVWNQQMRRFDRALSQSIPIDLRDVRISTAGAHLQEMVRQHIGSLRKRLRQNLYASYDWLPIPPVHYDNLANELWCHRYYLGNLCDQSRFQDWKIEHPIGLLMAVLDEWRAEAAKLATNRFDSKESDATKCTYGEARAILGLDSEGGSSCTGDNKESGRGHAIRRRYRVLARQYHPDRNPAPSARAAFERVQRAYEVLTSACKGDSQNTGHRSFDQRRVWLLVRTQVLLFSQPRLSKNAEAGQSPLAPFKYPCFQMLLDLLRLPAVHEESDMSSNSGEMRRPHHLVGSSESVTLRLAVEAAQLIYLICRCAPANAEELLRTGGLRTMCDLLTHTFSHMKSFCEDVSGSKSCTANAVVGLDEACTLGNKKFTSDSGSAVSVTALFTHLLRSLSGVVSLNAARNALSDDLLGDNQWHVARGMICATCGALELKSVSPLGVLYALQSIQRMSVCELLLSKIGSHKFEIVNQALQKNDITFGSYRARHGIIQRALVGFGGALWFLLPLACTYDPTVDDPTSSDKTVNSPLRVLSPAAARNQSASHASRTLSLLCGLLSHYGEVSLTTPYYDEMQITLDALLTPGLAALLSQRDPGELLTRLTSNKRTVRVIWGCEMKQSILDFAKQERARPIPSHDVAPEEAASGTLTRASTFIHSELLNEVRVGGAYLSVFNAHQEQAMIFVHEEGGGEALTVALLAFAVEQNPLSSAKTIIALDSMLQLANICSEDLCTGLCKSASSDGILPRLAKFCRLLREAHDVRSRALRVLSSIVALDCCASSVRTLGDTSLPFSEICYTLRHLRSASRRCTENFADYDACISILATLLSHPRCIGDGLRVGIILDLLHAFASTGGEIGDAAALETRYMAAAAISVCLRDNAHGAAVESALERLLPRGLILLLREDTDGRASVSTFDESIVETPDLIWDASMRDVFRNALREDCRDDGAHLTAAITAQLAPQAVDQDNGDSAAALLVYERLEGLLVVGGVYIELFLKDPHLHASSLRDPADLLEALLDRFTIEGQIRLGLGGRQGDFRSPGTKSLVEFVADDPVLTPLVSTVVCLLRSIPTLLPHAAVIGWPATAATLLCKAVDANSAQGAVASCCLRVLHPLSESAPCVRELCKPSLDIAASVLATITPIHANVSFALDVLKRCIKHQPSEATDSIVAQTLRANAISTFIDFLDDSAGVDSLYSTLNRCTEDAAAVRVHCITILKAMEADPRHGEVVRATLTRHAGVWARYSGQKHDLFVSRTQAARRDIYLTQGEEAEARAKRKSGMLLADAQTCI